MTANPLAPRGSAKPPSLPEPLALLTLDSFTPRMTVGFIPTGWTPPASVSPEMAERLPELIAAFERALVPADPKSILVHLSKLAMSCRMEDMPDRAWEMHLGDFIADLGNVPEDIVADCCSVWRRTRKFWPTISEFLEMTGRRVWKRHNELDRLRVLARVAKHPAPRGVVTSDWLRTIKPSS